MTTKTYTSTRKRVKAAAEAKPAPKKRGLPAGSKTKDPLIKAYEQRPVDWEALAKKLQRALAAQIKETQALEELVESHQRRIFAMENQSWLSRLLNLIRMEKQNG